MEMTENNEWERYKSRNNKFIKKKFKKEIHDKSLKKRPDFIKIAPKSVNDQRSDNFTSISNHVVLSLKKGNKWTLANHLNEMISQKIETIAPEELPKKKLKSHHTNDDENFKDNFNILVSRRTSSPKNQLPKSRLINSSKTTSKYKILKYELNDPSFMNDSESDERNTLNNLEKAYKAINSPKSLTIKADQEDTLVILPNNEISGCDLCYDAHSNLLEHEKCHHKACDTCWQTYFKELLLVKKVKKLKCIYEACNTLVNEDFVKMILPNVNYQRPTEHAKCPYCKKSIKLDFKSPNNTSSCVCKNKICNNCKLEDHYPMDCQSYKKFNQNFNSENYMLVKNCPKCLIMIEKLDGCNHMNCGYCGKEFCWDCQANYEKPHKCRPKKPKMIYLSFFGAPNLQKLYVSVAAQNKSMAVSHDRINLVVQKLLRQNINFEYYQVKFIYEFLVQMEAEMAQIYSFFKNFSYYEMVKFLDSNNEEKQVYQVIQDGLRICFKFFSNLQNISSFYDIYQLYSLNKRMKHKMEHLLLRI
jgi:hypothetical protein